ncbi:ThiF family adenylyltransferase [Vogesella indigofera]|uniref:ThiF family adenylyltransferase n=1 Tax=Vogesella indigofera TaxID=45465 RepID=UPI00234FAACD|nr:ThiF family adenylyltransferase [Vogesella indigofera]MDC7709054.1 ThiF family adenylyltransferase [Vogesella indigofera]
MLANQTAPNPDLQRLVDDGFHVSLEGPYLVIHRVPYVTKDRAIGHCSLISTYNEHEVAAGQINDHTVFVVGEIPHRDDGVSLQEAMVANPSPQIIAGRTAGCMLSYKTEPLNVMLANYYNKMTHYVRKLGSYAEAIDSSANLRGTGSFSARAVPSVFHFPNGSSARAGLEAYEQKLELDKVAIIGLGGTGSYLLDGLAKTPAKEIHLYDNDILEPHNAFRFPSALPMDTVFGRRKKTDVLTEIYSQFRSGIISRPERVSEANLHELQNFQFVFIAVDNGPSRGIIANYLVANGIPFIDVGIGIDKISDAVQLHARTRVTLITRDTAHLVSTLPVADDTDEAVYGNIQLAELNSLNANQALIRYKQHLQFFTDEVRPNVINYKCSWSQCVTQ